VVRIALTQAQMEAIARCDQPVEVVDAAGRFIGVLTCVPPEPDAPLSLTADAIHEVIDRIKEPVENLLSTSQAIERIRSRVSP